MRKGRGEKERIEREVGGRERREGKKGKERGKEGRAEREKRERGDGVGRLDGEDLYTII